MAKVQKLKFGTPTISLSELRSMLEMLDQIPDEDDEPYVHHEISNDDESFRFFMTTKALIKNVCHANWHNADATYKLLWQGFPVLIVGTTDYNKKFHLIGVAVSMNEKEEDFEFLFASAQKCAVKLLDFNPLPTVVVCDAAKAISNAFKSVFGDNSLVIMCWAHMRKNVKNKLTTLVKNKASRDGIIQDITFLQIIEDENNFKCALDLF